jgi:hypothetical protein
VASQRFCGLGILQGTPVFKYIFVDLALWVATRRNRQAAAKAASAEWWTDLSEAIEEGVSISEIRARRLPECEQ